MRKTLLLVLCMLALLTGETGVALLHLPWGYALFVAIISGVLGLLSWHIGGARDVSPEDEEFDRFIEGMIALCPWMSEHDLLLLRWAFHPLLPASLLSPDVEVVANAARDLHARAQSVGDRRRAWVFEQRYREVCAWKRGQEYAWPALPHSLEDS